MVNRWSAQWNTKSGLPVLDGKKTNFGPCVGYMFGNSCWMQRLLMQML